MHQFPPKLGQVRSMATPSFSSLPSFPFPYSIPFYRGFGGFNPGKKWILQMLVREFQCILDIQNNTFMHLVSVSFVIIYLRVYKILSKSQQFKLHKCWTPISSLMG